jgi:hypothetical protein
MQVEISRRIFLVNSLIGGAVVLTARIGKAMTHLIMLSQPATPPAQEIF